MLSKCYVKYQKLENNYDVAIFVTSCARDTDTNSQNGLNIMSRTFHSFKSKIRLWLSYFICDNKHTFGKQMPPDLA